MKLIRMLLPMTLIASAAVGILPPLARAEITLKESATLRAIANECFADQHKIDDFMKRHFGSRSAPTNAAKTPWVPEALALLAHPRSLPPAYWQVRDRALSIAIRDNATAREFSAADGRLNQVELACAGNKEKQLWKLLASRAHSSRSNDPALRKQLATSWKNWLHLQTTQPLSYPQYLKIIETATMLSQYRLLKLSPNVIEFNRKMEGNPREPATATKRLPQIANAQDPKWLEWARSIQKRDQFEREIMPTAQKSLAELVLQ
jgi:hypothetical protein